VAGEEREGVGEKKNAEETGTRYRIGPIDAPVACKRAKMHRDLSRVETHGCTAPVRTSLS